MAGARRLVFLDASVWIAAAHSPTGGSSLSIEVVCGSRFHSAASLEVLEEARRNIAGKMGEAELVRFYELLAKASPTVVSPVERSLLDYSATLTSAKDAQVLAAARACKAEFLLTLDRRHLLTERVLGAKLDTTVCTPGQFLEEAVREGRQAP